MKKVLFLTSRLPYPATSGRKNVMYNYCRILNEKIGYKIVNVSFLESGDDIKLKPDFIDKTYELKKISMKTKVINIIKKTILGKSFPLQVSLYWSRKTKKEIDRILKEEKPDIVISDMIRMSEYLKNYEGYKISNLDDLISIRYNRQLKVDINLINPYGAYLYTLPKSIQKIISINFIKRLILNKEIKLIKKYENNIAKEYDNIIFVAEKEAKIINSKIGQEKALAVPLGVDIDYFSEYYNKLQVDEDSIVFLGVMNVAHNETAVINFIKNIFPIILKSKPDIKFYIVGSGVTERLKQYSSKNIIFTGRVDDVRMYVGKCKVFICPLIFGSGIKTKNLEAMAMGIPIVTTSIGAENIHAKNGEEWLIADSDQDFAKAIVSLIDDRDLYEKIQKNALKFVSDNFTWSIAEKRLKKMLMKKFENNL